jgi:hypothetical protein
MTVILCGASHSWASRVEESTARFPLFPFQ